MATQDCLMNVREAVTEMTYKEQFTAMFKIKTEQLNITYMQNLSQRKSLTKHICFITVTIYLLCMFLFALNAVHNVKNAKQPLKFNTLLILRLS